MVILELAGGFGRYFLDILRIQGLNNLVNLLTFSETWFRLINYSHALVLLFFFSKSLNILISFAAVA